MKNIFDYHFYILNTLILFIASNVLLSVQIKGREYDNNGEMIIWKNNGKEAALLFSGIMNNSPAISSTISPIQQEQVRVIVGTANVRSGEGTEYSVIITVSYGTYIPVLDKEGSWFKVHLTPELGTDADYGFIHDSTVELIHDVQETLEDLPEIVEVEEIEKDVEIDVEIEKDEDEYITDKTEKRFFPPLPPLSLSGGIIGWGGTIQQAGFEIAASIGSRPARFRPVWGKAGLGSFTTEWLGIEIQSYVGHISNMEMRIGIAGGRYSEFRTFSSSEENNSKTRISENDLVFGLIVSSRWLMEKPFSGTEVDISFRWKVGLGRDEEYHIPSLRATVGIFRDRTSPAISYLDAPRLSVYIGSGISPGKAKDETLIRPLIRFGADMYIGDLELRLMSASQIQKGLIAPSVGSAMLVKLLTSQPLSIHLGGGIRWYNEFFDNEQHQAWMGGIIGELRYKLDGRMCVFFTFERSWGFADAGHLVRIDDITLGIRRILWN